MIAVIRAIRFVGEWIVGRLDRGNEWGGQWWSKLFGIWAKLFELLWKWGKKLDWAFAGAIAFLAVATAGAGAWGSMLIETLKGFGQLVLGFQSTQAANGVFFPLSQLWKIGNYLIPLEETGKLLAMFILLKSVVTIGRLLVKLYELVPFKAS